jgi:uncharacterized secreted protein with C-terminal beta-propeller domain
MSTMKRGMLGIGAVGIAIAVIVAAAFVFSASYISPSQPLPKFSSCRDMADTLSAGVQAMQSRYASVYGDINMAPLASSTTGAAKQSESGAGYSTTNIQVEGVDEADIVKTDGTHIYTLSSSGYGYYGGNSKLVIASAYPAERASILSMTNLTNFTPSEMFIDGNRLLIFGTSYEQIASPGPVPMAGKVASSVLMPEYYYPYYSKTFATAKLWDITDKSSPKLVRSVDFEGSYLQARMVGGYAYFVINTYPNFYPLLEEVNGGVGIAESNASSIIPLYRDSAEGSGARPTCGCADIGYVPPVQPENFMTIASISMRDDGAPVKKQVVLGSGQNVYASLQNIYVAETNWPYYWGIDYGADSTESTAVRKFGISNGEITYQGSGSVPGRILNQFSMDEHNGYFRIATTVGHVSRSGESSSSNNVYVLNSNLNVTGRLEGIAPGEQIYSARFMGDRGYLVTFKKVDPFFVIDLSEPTTPKILGKLKIPGYSDYLHPYDENHIIGIGKDTIEAEEGTFAWYQGVKMAIFDVTDVSNPVELHKVVIGDRGTDSEVLSDHKAFLFDREKGLLVLPITLAEIPNKTDAMEGRWPKYGEFTFQGAYVFGVSLDGGFALRGRITHDDSGEAAKKSGYWYGSSGNTVRRSLYIGNVLYTISNNKIKANSLSDLSELKQLVMNTGAEQDYPTLYV